MHGVQVDHVKAHNEIQIIIEILEEKRANVDAYFASLFKISTEIASSVGVTPSQLPRTCGRQNNRNNVPAESLEEYYRRTIAIPFLDHMISELKRRFNAKHAELFVLSRLICSNVYIQSAEQIAEIAQTLSKIYAEDFTDENIVPELTRWRKKCFDMSADLRPTTTLESLNLCNPEYFPNVFVLLKILAILPVSSSQCERSFSTMKRLKTYLRSTMGQTRLTSLALMNIHHDTVINPEDVVTKFLSDEKRRLW